MNINLDANQIEMTTVSAISLRALTQKVMEQAKGRVLVSMQVFPVGEAELPTYEALVVFKNEKRCYDLLGMD